VCLALAKLAVQPKGVGKIEGGGGGWGLLGEGETRHKIVKNGWPVFASLSWAMVMYVFRWHPETIQSSLRSSMSYMWVFLSIHSYAVAILSEVMLTPQQLCAVGRVGFAADVVMA
jgi:hypothetical protein